MLYIHTVLLFPDEPSGLEPQEQNKHRGTRMQHVLPDSLAQLYWKMTDEDRAVLEAYAETRVATNPRPQLREFRLIVGGVRPVDCLKFR